MRESTRGIVFHMKKEFLLKIGLTLPGLFEKPMIILILRPFMCAEANTIAIVGFSLKLSTFIINSAISAVLIIIITKLVQLRKQSYMARQFE